MPDREKVIKGIHQHCEGSLFDRCGECPYYDLVFGSWGENKFTCRDELLSDALELLKEQEEKQEGLPPAWQDRTQEHICQKCGGIVWQEDNYCSKCGQAVKWHG